MNTTPDNELMKIADAAFLSDEIPGHLRPWKSAEQWEYNAPARLIIAREIERSLLARMPQVERATGCGRFTDAQLQAAIDGAMSNLLSSSLNPDGALLDVKMDDSKENEAPARLALIKAALARLPEPLPHMHERHERIASAVLAAFGRSDLAEAIAKMEAVSDGAIQKAYWEPGPWMKNVRELFIEAARGEESQPAALIAEHTPLTADQWAKRWQAEADARNAQFKELQEWKAKYEKVERRLNTANDVIFRLKNEIERTRFFLITPPSDGSNEGEWIMRLFRYSLEVDNQTDACQSLADPVKEIQAMRGRIERQRRELSRIQGAVSKAENSSREAKNKSGIYASIVDKVRRLLNAELEESTERAAQRAADEIQEMREAIMGASGIVEMIAESDLSHNSLPMCPECHAISSYEEMHAECCKIGQLLAKFQPFIKP